MLLDEEKLSAISFGRVGIAKTNEGFVFDRFTPAQKEYFRSKPKDIFAELPDDYFYQNCFTDAGIMLDFYTDASSITVDIASITPQNNMTFTTTDIAVDGKIVASCESAGLFTAALPGKKARVTVFFPYIARLIVKSITLDGTYAEPVKKEKLLLAIGDSITHGYICMHPANMHMTRIGLRYNCEVINQASGGFVHYAGMIAPVTDASGNVRTPDIVTVAFGINDISRKNYEQNYADMVDFYAKLRQTFPKSRIITISPIWTGYMFQRKLIPTRKAMYALFDKISAQFDTELIDGLTLVPHNGKYLADGLHPNDDGAAFYALRLGRKIFKK